MATQTSLTQAQRIGKLKGEILKHVIPQEVIGRVCRSMKKPIPKNGTDTVVFRRWLPQGATSNAPNTWSIDPAALRISEGEAPAARTLQAMDIQATLDEYGIVFRYTNRVEELYEDDVPSEMKAQTGQSMGLLLEMVRYGRLKAATNVYRAGNVTSRSSVIGTISANVLANVARGLFANQAMKVTGILAPSPNIGTSSVEAAYVVVMAGDLENDVRALPNFTHVSDYGSRQPIHENEIGSYNQFRFIASPHLAPYTNGGGTTTANTRLAAGVPNATGSENVDVYPMLVLTEETYGEVTLRGMDNWKAFSQSPGSATANDPLGQLGFVSARTYYTVVRLNELQMAVVECACSSL